MDGFITYIDGFGYRRFSYNNKLVPKKRPISKKSSKKELNKKNE